MKRDQAAHAFRALFVTTVLLQGSYAAVKVLISYRVLAMGGGASQVGTLVALYSLMPLLAAVQVGRAVDRGAATRTARIGAVVTLAGVTAVLLSPNIFMLGIASTTLGFGQMASMIAAQGLIPQLGDPAGLDSRFGAWSVAVSLGQTLGVPMTGVIVASTDDHDAGIVLALVALEACCVVAVVLTFMPWLARAVPSHRRAEVGTTQPIRDMILIPGMRSAIFASVVVLVAIDLLAAYLPVLGVERGFGVLTVSLMLTGRSVAALIARILMSPIRKRARRESVLVLSTAVSGPMILVVAFAPVAWTVACALVIAGFAWGLGQPMSMTWVAGLVSPSNRASALSLRLTGNRIGQVVMPLGAAAVAGTTGVGAIFAAVAGLLMLSAYTTRRALDGSTAPE